MRDDVAFGPANLGYRGDELTARVERALAAVGMAEFADRPPHHLSFGQRRRVAAATVLSMDPTLLVLDEPSSNLDPAARREFAEIVLSLGLTTLIVTHDLLYALQLCPRSVIMNGGRIVADGPTGRDPRRRRPARRQPARAAVRIRASRLTLAGPIGPWVSRAGARTSQRTPPWYRRDCRSTGSARLPRSIGASRSIP